MSDKIVGLNRGQKESPDADRAGRPDKAWMVDLDLDAQRISSTNPADLYVDEKDEPIDAENESIDLGADYFKEKDKGNALQQEDEKFKIDIKLKLNTVALEKVTEDNESIRASTEKFCETWAEDPANITAVGFETNGRIFTSIVMYTRDEDRYAIPLHIFRQSVEGVSGSKNHQDEMWGIKLKAEDGKEIEINPTTQKLDIINSMRRVRIGGTRLKDSTNIFVHNEKPILAGGWPEKERVDHTAMIANYP